MGTGESCIRMKRASNAVHRLTRAEIEDAMWSWFAAFVAMTYYCVVGLGTSAAEQSGNVADMGAVVEQRPHQPSTLKDGTKPIEPYEAVQDQRFIGAILCDRGGIYLFKPGRAIGYMFDRTTIKVDYGKFWINTKNKLCFQWKHWDGNRVHCGHPGILEPSDLTVFEIARGDNCWRLTVIPDNKSNENNHSEELSYSAERMIEVLEDISEIQSLEELRRQRPDLVTFAGRDSKITNTNALNKILDNIDYTRKEFAGYVASALVLLTFCMREMFWLRTVALCSNAAFITYGYIATLPPVFFLHVVLMPINFFRLMQLLKVRTENQ